MAKSPNKRTNPLPVVEKFHVTPVAAIVPEHLHRGAVATSLVVVKAEEVYLADFLCAVAYPVSIVARIIMTPRTLTKSIESLETALQACGQSAPARRHRKGTVTTPTAANSARKPADGDEPLAGFRIRDLYDELRSCDRILAGTFADSLMVRHTDSEICLDFFSNFYPKSYLAARLIIPAGRVPGLLQTLRDASDCRESPKP